MGDVAQWQPGRIEKHTMSLFDHYRPSAELRCPACHRVLREWQGKDGPNGMFVWEQGVRAPVDQAVDEELRLTPDALERVALPERFVIYSYDCPEHQPIEAECRAVDGAWVETNVRAPAAR
jgi:hypothetical protein